MKIKDLQDTAPVIQKQILIQFEIMLYFRDSTNRTKQQNSHVELWLWNNFRSESAWVGEEQGALHPPGKNNSLGRKQRELETKRQNPTK